MKIIAIVVFIAVILLIMTERVHQTAAALAGAVTLVLTGVMTADKALSYIDFNTIGMLVGMMILVAIIRKSGMFEYIAVRSAKAVHGDPWKIMVAFVLITAVLSSILDNVTTVLLVGPMTIAIARMLDINPVPFLMTQILASNIGGTATLIGDPPNIMIGSAAGLSFTDFLANTGVCVIFVMLALLLMMRIFYKKQVESGDIDTERVMALDPDKSISDRALMNKGIAVIILTIIGFIFHDKIGVDSAVIALTAAAVMLLISHQDVDEAISGVEWTTIVFFMSLFVVVGGLTETGVIKSLSTLVINMTNGHPVVTMVVLLWVSVEPLWWAISLGACLGGNGTMIGASANVVLSDISTKHGYPITFQSYLKTGMPFMLVSVGISMVFLLVKFAV